MKKKYEKPQVEYQAKGIIKEQSSKVSKKIIVETTYSSSQSPRKSKIPVIKGARRSDHFEEIIRKNIEDNGISSPSF